MSFLLAAIAFGVLIAFHEAGHMWVARKVGMRVEKFSIGFGPVIFARTVGETEYAISAIPLGGYVKIAGMSPEDEVAADDPASYANRPAWARLAAIAAGPGANYLLAFLIGIPLLLVPGPVVDTQSTKLGEVVAGEPAQLAGLTSGDRVLSVDGREVSDFYTLKEAIGAAATAHPEQPLQVRVERGDNQLTLPVRPRSVNGSWVIGVTPGVTMQPGLPFWKAVPEAGARLWTATARSMEHLTMLFSGKAKVSDLSGPIGMISMTASQARKGFLEYMQTVWSLSVAIGFFNLLPIPALDGGRVCFLAYEILTRRRVSERLENAAHTVGFVLLLTLIAFVSWGDIVRRFKGG